MKKLIALMLVVALAATTLCIPAAAASNSHTGNYNGKHWIATVSISGANNFYVSCAFTVSAGGFVTSRMGARYYYPGQSSQQANWHNRPVQYSDFGSTIDAATYSNVYVTQARMTYDYKTLSGVVYVSR